jgi:hypothetical protein
MFLSGHVAKGARAIMITPKNFLKAPFVNHSVSTCRTDVTVVLWQAPEATASGKLVRSVNLKELDSAARSLSPSRRRRGAAQP